MELVLNRFNGFRNHREAITGLLSNAQNVCLAVAFIKDSGLVPLIDVLSVKNAKVICSLEFGTTDHSSLQLLLEKGIRVKFCKLNHGILHSKIWLFKNNENTQALVGSANLTESALAVNSETSVVIDYNENRVIVDQLSGYFNYLWDRESCAVTQDVIDNLVALNQNQESIKNRVENSRQLPTDDTEVSNSIVQFVFSWIDIGTTIHIPGSRGKLWRGWYIIPDQGMIDDMLMDFLKQILIVIHQNGNSIDTRVATQMESIYIITRTTFKNTPHMTERELFVRQQKNLLIKFDFAYHPLKPNGAPNEDIVALTDYGIEIASLANGNIAGYKRVFTKAMRNYTYNSFQITPFVTSLVDEFGYLDFFEFSNFVNHVYSQDKYDLVKQLIILYRSCSPDAKRVIHSTVDQHFEEILAPSANNVRGNYDKKVRHQMSVIGWLTGYHYDPVTRIIRKLA